MLSSSRWNTWKDMDLFRRELDRVFDDFWPSGSRLFRSAFLPGRSTEGYPLVNLYEDPEAVRVEALAPGLEPDSLQGGFEGSMLKLSGRKTAVPEIETDQYHRCERAAGEFERTIRIATSIDDSKITADYSAGILTVVLPKAEKAKPKQISVKVK